MERKAQSIETDLNAGIKKGKKAKKEKTKKEKKQKKKKTKKTLNFFTFSQRFLSFFIYCWLLHATGNS